MPCGLRSFGFSATLRRLSHSSRRALSYPIPLNYFLIRRSHIIDKCTFFGKSEKSITERQAKRGFFAKSVSKCHFYESLPLLESLSFFVSTGGFCRALKIFSQICHKVLTFAGNRTIMKTTFFEIEKSCLRSVGIRRKGAAARAPQTDG